MLPQECVDVIATHEGKFVVIERLNEPKGLAWPGGKIEPGEDSVSAVKREMEEETGLAVAITGIVGRYDAPNRDVRNSREHSTTTFSGVAHGKIRDEAGRTQVLLLSRSEVEYRKNEFILDHYRMFCDLIRFTGG